MAKPQRGSIAGAFAWRLIEMLESPAHRTLSLSARKILDRLEIELYRHGGKPEENGRLPCTFDHFVEFGIHRHAIGPAIREGWRWVSSRLRAKVPPETQDIASRRYIA
jgi:hypothetical protein